jgi:hypothetical protein
MLTMAAPVLGPIGELKAHATAYADVGLLIFPLNADKTPRTTNGMKDATTDVDQVATWWDQWPDALIGCRIPPDVVVIDVDPKHNGMSTWKLLKETFGDLPLTRSHKSGRNDGGGHLWFKRPAAKLSIRPLNRWAKDHGTGEAAGKHSWVAGVDLLHWGHRYSVLPPSLHEATGAPYRWVEGRDLAVEPAELPDWLAALITEHPAPIITPAPRISHLEVDSIADWFTATASWADLLIPEGWTLVSGGGDEDGAKWRHPNATSAWSATVKHGCLFVYSGNTDFDMTSEGDPHGYTRFKALALLGHGGDQSAAARKARYLRDGTTSSNGNRADDWGWVGLTRGVGADVVMVVADDDGGLRQIHWPDFWKREHTLDDWLIEPVVPAGRQVAIWATHKTGKSLITLEIAAAATTGTPCFGQPPKPPIDVIYLDMEMTEDDLEERLEDLGYGPDSPLDRLHYYLLPALPPLDTPAGAAALLELVDLHQPALVVIDTMARIVAGEENDADTYRDFYRHTGIQLKARRVGLLRLDHAGKNTDQGQRGSSAKGDDVDVVWQLRSTDNGLELVRHAARMSWVPERVTLHRHEEPTLHHTVARGDWPAGTAAIADILDTLCVPLDASRSAARAKLTLFNHKARNDILGKALKLRRQRALDPKDLI